MAVSVHLTDRDYHLLNLLYEHSLMSLGQISRYVFTGRDHSTVLNRIRLLEDGGYLKRHHLNRVRTFCDEKSVGVVLQITPRGVREIARLHFQNVFDEKIYDIKSSQLEHDLLLVDVTERLKNVHEQMVFVDGRRFVRSKPEIFQVPDKVMVDGSRSKATAIELELTVKSEKRYRQIITNYRIGRGFDRVLFITAHQSIAQKIKSEIVGFKTTSTQNFETGIFALQNMQELLRPQT